MTRSSSTVCVIGGGISGLVVAHELSSAARDLNVIVLEGSDRLGGAIRTETIEGVPVETGADSFLTRAPDAVELCRSVGLTELIDPAVFGGTIWSAGRLVELPPEFVFGMPPSARSALEAGHLNPVGRIRAALEPFLPGRPLGADVSVGEIVRRRYGRALLQRSVDPLLAGTRAGRVDEMSFEAALPQLWSLVHGRRSITRAIGRALADNLIPEGPPPFKSIAGGLTRLVEALTQPAPNVEFRLNNRAESVAVDDRRWRVRTADGEIDCNAVVLALPAYEAAGLLKPVDPSIADLLQSIESASVASIVLVYPPDALVRPLPGSGMLVPSNEGVTVSACTWYSVKWPAATPANGGFVLRAFVGRAGHNPALDLDDHDLADLVARELEGVLDLTQRPRSTLVTRWNNALPQYRVGHSAVVDRIEQGLGRVHGVWVTGASYRGSGIPDCVRHARATAARVLDLRDGPNR